MATKKKSHPAVLIIFGAFFALVGCVPGFFAFKALAFAHATNGWSATTATIVRLELQRDGKNNSNSQVVATYLYRAPEVTSPEAGSTREYSSNRVGIHSGSDNVTEWHQETFQRLEQARRAASTVPCWYDPADPAQAVLDRDPRWSMIGFLMIFPLVFGLFGGGIAALGIFQWRKNVTVLADPQALARVTVISANGNFIALLWIITVIWNVIAWIVTVTVLQGGTVPVAVKLGTGFFPLVGGILLLLALIETVRGWRHGRPRLRLEQGAWLTGRRVVATVLMETEPGPQAQIHARILVVRSMESGSGKNRTITDVNLWSCEVVVDPALGRRGGSGWEQVVELPLPSDLPASSLSVSSQASNEDTVTWSLEYQVIRPGPDLSATFTLPTAAADDGALLYSSEQKISAERATPLAVLARAGISIAEQHGDVVISLPGWRNPWLYGSGFVGTLLLSLAALLLVEQVSWWSVLGSVPLLVWCWRGVLRSAWWRSTIILSGERITIEAGWWRQRRHELRVADIRDLSRHSSMASGDIAYFDMWFQATDDTRITIARGVPGAAETRLTDIINTARRSPA